MEVGFGAGRDNESLRSCERGLSCLLTERAGSSSYRSFSSSPVILNDPIFAF